MPNYRIRMFGTLELLRDAAQLAPFPTYKARALFCYLVLHRDREHTREMLAETFWGEHSDADSRKCLRTELWRIRRVLGDNTSDAHHLLAVHDQQIRFRAPAACWIDVLEFEQSVNALAGRSADSLTTADSERLRSAVDLYHGHLLEEIYDEWCLYDRERLRLMYHNALTLLLNYSLWRADWPAAILYGDQLLAGDPMLEHVHRTLMRCHYAMGNRAAAVRQYRECARKLMLELEVEPMQETRLLFEQIYAESADLTRSLPTPVPIRPDARAIARARLHFKAANQYARRAERHLRLGIDAASSSEELPEQ